MVNENDSRLLAKLQTSYPAVAIKFCLEKPADAEHYEGEKLAFCQYLKGAQDTGKHFYITAEDDACYGKLSLGMADLQPVTASGKPEKTLDALIPRCRTGCSTKICRCCRKGRSVSWNTLPR